MRRTGSVTGVVPKPAEDVFAFLAIIAEVLTPAMDAPAA
jgi:hypothetical protein